MTENDIKLLNIEEMAQVLNVSKPTLYRIVEKDSDFPVYRVGNSLRFDRDKVLDYTKKQEG